VNGEKLALPSPQISIDASIRHLAFTLVVAFTGQNAAAPHRTVKFSTSGRELACPLFGSCLASTPASCAGGLSERGPSAQFQAPLGIEEAVKFDKFGNESGPAGLVAGT
jgi:hypothetical protein